MDGAVNVKTILNSLGWKSPSNTVLYVLSLVLASSDCHSSHSTNWQVTITITMTIDEIIPTPNLSLLCCDTCCLYIIELPANLVKGRQW